MVSDRQQYHPVTIGSVHCDGNLFLAPLAGYTDRAFRSICIDHGANLTFSEMVSAEGLARESEATKNLTARAENENQLAIQIFMHAASVVERSLDTLLQCNPTIIDINCGCPVPKVIKTGAGSALLKDPQSIYDIVHTITSRTSVPVSVKIRLGWDASSINYHDTADAALSAGAAMITMHARTRAMGYSGTADWDALYDLKQWVLKRYPSVPVFGSGDLFTYEAAATMLRQTHVDGLMFARGALGNPWIFQDTKTYLLHQKLPDFHVVQERVSVLLAHLHRAGANTGEQHACREMRKHATSYLKGIPHAAQAKQALVKASTYAAYEDVCAQLVQELE